jgi:hypothetical protein
MWLVLAAVLGIIFGTGVVTDVDASAAFGVSLDETPWL